METFWIKALQLIAAFSLLVVIHEFGHYLWARLFRIRVEKFYLFFNPWFSLLQYDPKKGTLRLGTWTKTKKKSATTRQQREKTGEKRGVGARTSENKSGTRPLG